MNIQRFEKAEADKAHNGTILASDFVPKGVDAPFKSAWGFLENNSSMEAHSHAAVEIYAVIKGSGIVVVGDEKEHVSPGDVIEIPSNAVHTMMCEEGGPFLWTALWWDK
jgi:mannose-6-phosphate isomerase-like protein (cupin superfamily)